MVKKPSTTVGIVIFSIVIFIPIFIDSSSSIVIVIIIMIVVITSDLAGRVEEDRQIHSCRREEIEDGH